MTLQELKEKDLAPSFFTEESLQTVNSGYLLPGETPKGMYERVAKSAALNCKRPDLEKEFFEIIYKNWLCPSTPVLSNSGTERGLTISCFGLYTPDSVDGIFKTIHEAAMLTKGGGGIGSYWSSVRGRGANIKGNGKSEGVIPWLAVLDRTAVAVGQGGVRRAGIQATLDIDHADYEEFLRIRRPLGDVNRQCLNLHHAVNINDDFMNRVESGDSKARAKWVELLKMRVESGEPYMVFIDNANTKNVPEVARQRKIYHSQLCIAGDQRVVTSDGYLTAKELFERNKKLTLFNGYEAVPSSEMKLRELNAEILKITLDNGMSQKVTLYHGVPVCNKNTGKIKRVEAKDVKVGDLIPVQANKGLFGKVEMEDEAYLLGLYQGDGTQHNDYRYIDVWEKDFDLIPKIEEVFNRVHFKYAPKTYEIVNQYGAVIQREYLPASFGRQKTYGESAKKQRLGSKILSKIEGFEKGKVPNWIWEGTEKTQWNYIKGLLETDGTVYASKSKGNPIQLNLASIDLDFLKQIQLIMNNLGLYSSVRLLRKGGSSFFPDHKGGQKEYQTKDCYRLIVGNRKSAIEIEKNTGFLTRKKITIEERKYRDNIKKKYKVVSIEPLGREDVYCPTIYNDEHIFVANGALTFNCSEIFLPNDEDHTYVCCLSSLNLVRYDEWKSVTMPSGLTVVELSMYFLEGIMQEFIDNAKKLPGFEKAVRFSEKARALGLGVLGWHSLLQSRMLPFDSFQSMMLNAEIFRKIQAEALSASQKMAIEFGEPEWCKGYGVRHLTQLAIAPTMSNSIIAGGHSAGIEPITSNYYAMKSAKGTFMRKNPILTALLEERGLNTVEIWDKINKTQGSVQNLKELSKEEKEVFKTAREINQFALIKQASQRQKWIDQGQSLNLFVTAGASAKYINELHLEAWRQGLKSLYYLRTESVLKGSRVQEYSKTDCASCEG